MSKVRWENANIRLIHKKNHQAVQLTFITIQNIYEGNFRQETLDFNQPREQAGFRKVYSLQWITAK